MHNTFSSLPKEGTDKELCLTYKWDPNDYDQDKYEVEHPICESIQAPLGEQIHNHCMLVIIRTNVWKILILIHPHIIPLNKRMRIVMMCWTCHMIIV